eukprot:537452-Rhodomonas_salina.1
MSAPPQTPALQTPGFTPPPPRNIQGLAHPRSVGAPASSTHVSTVSGVGAYGAWYCLRSTAGSGGREGGKEGTRRKRKRSEGERERG